jgi:hypothetical protein
MPSRHDALVPILLLLCLVLRPAPAQGSGGPPGSAAALPGSGSLAAARSSALAAKTRPDFALILGGLADGLRPVDELALLREFSPGVADTKASKALLSRAGYLALLLGDYAQAADLLETAAFRLPTARDDLLLLRAARCHLASGNAEKAQDRGSIVLRSAPESALLLEAKIVLGWASLLSGDRASALSQAKLLLGAAPGGAGAAPGSAENRELRFMAWVASEQAGRPAMAAALVKEYPDSPEAGLVLSQTTGSASGKAGVPSDWARLSPLPHWYLSGLITGVETSVMSDGSGTPAPTAALGGVAPTPITGGAAPTPTTGGAAVAGGGVAKRYQIGIFSEAANAADLVAELAKKGFSAKTEKRKLGARELIAVIVEPASGETNLVLRLKDAGYEAYPLF